ncbi:hypothetical protein JRQ81_014223 [Phrynocephalus forsythii]|uniref:Reverse transcriptase domain-containing protein n=1 Tax=Phrynocephalus forsythii TaxID=171643 RepID=A0A9Q0XWA6_9SAUR|nr:hypothetical protein JRQ81_014223 [Phrynocephalus forsythii]
MGTHTAPQYANIFMADLEQHSLNHCTQKPLLYLRYINDVFLIWTHGEESFKKFHQDFSSFHPNINFTLEQSTQLKYPPCMIKEQINKARRIPRDNLLQDRSKRPNDRIPLVVTYSPQARPLTCILIDLQPIPDKNTSLSKALDLCISQVSETPVLPGQEKKPTPSSACCCSNEKVKIWRVMAAYVFWELLQEKAEIEKRTGGKMKKPYASHKHSETLQINLLARASEKCAAEEFEVPSL